MRAILLTIAVLVAAFFPTLAASADLSQAAQFRKVVTETETARKSQTRIFESPSRELFYQRLRELSRNARSISFYGYKPVPVNDDGAIEMQINIVDGENSYDSIMESGIVIFKDDPDALVILPSMYADITVIESCSGLTSYRYEIYQRLDDYMAYDMINFFECR